VLLESFHDGPLAQTGSYLRLEPDTVVAGAVKLAEDGDDLVVRVVETAGRSAPARIRLPAWDREVAFDIRPFEIRTFRIPRDPSGDVAETDLLERPAAT
jgi:alpha-mannosidase